MVSTITVSTVTTVTTVTMLSMISTVGGMVVVISLIRLLASKEPLANSSCEGTQLLARYLNVGIVPLMIVFTTIIPPKLESAIA